MNQHSGNMLNAITYEEHDGILNAKKVSLVSAATIFAVTSSTQIGLTTLGASPNFIGIVTIANPGATGNVTLDKGSLTGIIGNLTLSDPKGFIGLVTVVGSLSPAVGNITLDKGSLTGISGNITVSDSKGFIGLVTTQAADPKGYIGLVTVTQASSARTITGNLTLSDPKGFIGLTTTVNGQAWPDPKGYIGLVTITGSLAPAAGNITLDAGSKTGIVGNVTLSDSKGFIGLVTLGGGTAWADPKTYIGLMTVNNATAWTDPKTYIGLVTITGSLSAAAGNITLDRGSLTGLVGNLTLSDSKQFIGLVTLGGGTAWADPKGYIGLVTITGSLAPAAGNITLDKGSLTGISGNVTLSDSKGFIGLVTITGTTRDTFASLQTLTISLASIASSTGGVGRQSTFVDNTSNRYTEANIYLKFYTGGVASTPNSLIYTYLLRYDNNTVADDNAGTTDAALTVINAPLLGTTLVTTSLASTAYVGVFNTRQYGSLGPKWGIAVVNSVGAALSGTEGNMLKNWIGINPQLG